MDAPPVRFELVDTVAWIRIGSQGELTLMSVPSMAQVREAVDQALGEESARVIVIAGEGTSFVAGADLAFIRSATEAEFRAFNRENQWLAYKLITCEKPTIAAINGHALGGGLEIALACDLRVCSAQAKIGFPEVSVGLLHSTGSSYLLPRLIGLARAKYLTLTGRILSAREALSYGLVDEVAERDQLEQAVSALASTIAAKAPVAVSWTKRIFDLGASTNLETALEVEAVGNRACFATQDRIEGANAFFEKRAPEFRGA